MSDNASGTSLDRVLDVLEAIVHDGHGTSLGDLSRRTGLMKPTAHRILHGLAQRGYAIRVGDGLYGPGPAVFTLASLALATLDHATQAAPAMTLLQEASGETVHFALLQGQSAVYVAKLESLHPYHLASAIGNRLALHSTSIGKAILAFLPDGERGDVLATLDLEPKTRRTISSRNRLAAELDLVRSTGYAIDDEENEEKVRCVGAAVFDHSGRVIGGLSVSAPAFHLTRVDAEALGPTVVAAGLVVSTRLGAAREALPRPYVLADPGALLGPHGRYLGTRDGE